MNLSWNIEGLFPKPTISIDIGSLSEDDLKTLNKLGQGACRTVFAYDEDAVLKVDRNRMKRHKDTAQEYWYNQNEWNFWESIKHSPVSRFFFPVLAFDPTTHFLLMEKAVRIPQTYPELEQAAQYPQFKKIMQALSISDMGPRNAGYKSDGTLAALDYGFQTPAKDEQIRYAELLMEKWNV
jgi:hypothetical protein